MNRKMLVGLGVAVALFGVVGCSGAGDAEETNSSESAAQELDMTNVPDIVAEVNGTEITKDDFAPIYEGQFQQMQMQAQASGQEIDQEALRTQTAQMMVDTELLTQEADARKIDAPQEDIDVALEDLAAAYQMESVDDVLAALNDEGMDEDEVLSELEMQVRLDRLIVEETGDIEPTDEELQELYDQTAAQQEQSGGEGAELPPFEEVKPQLIEQAISMKQSETYQALVTELQEDADVTIHL